MTIVHPLTVPSDQIHKRLRRTKIASECLGTSHDCRRRAGQPDHDRDDDRRHAGQCCVPDIIAKPPSPGRQSARGGASASMISSPTWACWSLSSSLPGWTARGPIWRWASPSRRLPEKVASRSSLTATAYRLVQATGYACAVVWSKGGITKWSRRSDEFGHWIGLRQRLDSRTFAADCFRGKKVPASQETVPASAWLEDDVPEDARIIEQTRCMPSYSGALTLLWLPEPVSSRTIHEEDGLEELNPDDFGLGRRNWPRKR